MSNKKFIFKLIIWVVLINMTIWSVGYDGWPKIQPAKAENGVNMVYLGSNNMPVMLTSTGTPIAAVKFEIYDTSGGYLRNLNVRVRKINTDNGFDPSIALNPLSHSNPHDSGMSLWLDYDEDGFFNTASDSPATFMQTSWTMQDAMTWSASFSSINWPIGLTYPTRTVFFLVFNAQDFAPDGPPYEFQAQINQNNMYVEGGSIGYWPSMTVNSDKIIIGDEGIGGMGSPIVISEILTASSTNEEEFVELYNRSPESIDLAGWSLKYSPPADTSYLSWSTILYEFSTTAPYWLPPGGFFLAGFGSTLSATADAPTPGNILDESGGYVGLFNHLDWSMDWVGYGSLASSSLAEGGQPATAPPSGGSIERKAFDDSTHSMMTAGGIDQFMGNSYDSNNNAADFIVRAVAEPQNSSSTPELPQGEYSGGGGGGSPLLINEIRYRADSSQRWFELYNRSDVPVNLNGHYLRHKGGSSYTFPGDIFVASYGYKVIHWNQTGTNDDTHFYTGSVGMDLDTYGGDLILKASSSGNIFDYVEYGGYGYYSESEAVAANQWMSGDYVPHCLYGESIGRRLIGEDYNKASDWQTYATPSPGAPNMGGDTTAPTTVTNVTLTDNDTTQYSLLDGRDITVIWTPAPAEDPSFARYEIFLLPSATQIDWNIHKPIDSLYGGQYQYDQSNNQLSTYTYTGGSWITKDSAGTALAETSYIAHVLAFDYSGNKSGSAQSNSYALVSEPYLAENDNNPPYIMHMGVWNASHGNDIQLVARFQDDRALDATNPAQVIWKAGTSSSYPDLSSDTTVTGCDYLDNGFYNCLITWGAWTTDSVIGYYLKAKDEKPNFSYLSSSPDADMSRIEANVLKYPFYIDIMAAPSDGDSDHDLTGYTYKWDGNVLASTTVFIEGTAIGPVTSSATGSFAFADNTLDYGSYNVMAFKSGYMNMMNTAYRGSVVNFYLNEGDTYVSGGGGSWTAGGNPIVKWTAPGDNMTGAPIDIFCTGDCSFIEQHETPVIIAFDRPMKSSTINDQNAADAGSNIYLTTNGNDRVSGQVYYSPDNYEARFFSSVHDTLQTGNYYNIVVTQGVTDEFGNPIIGANPDGSFSNGFTTVLSTTTVSATPPYVMGMTPSPGSFNIARNTSLILQFSEPMDSSTINSANIKLIPITNSTTWTEGIARNTSITLDQTTRRLATINPDDDLDSSYDWWLVKVMGDVKAGSGNYLGNPGGVAYQSSFQIDPTLLDATAPTITGTYPKHNDGITSTTTAVNVGIGAIQIGFSEPMDPGTINGQNIMLLAGTNVTGGKVAYDPMSNKAKFIPYNALLANTQYTLRVAANVTDLAGIKLAATSTGYFKTGAADTVAPEVMYANGDEYRIAVTFTEPMNTAKQTDAANWPYSVLNPANYAVNGFIYTDPQSCSGGWSCTVSLQTPYNGVSGTSLSGLGLSLAYEEFKNTVKIEGLEFGQTATDFQIFVDNVRDKSNNTIADSGARAASTTRRNAARSPIYSSADTYGSIDPGATDYTMDMGDMGMMKAGAFPMNTIAGQRSIYFVDIPTTKVIPSGGKIVLTFPPGFDVSAAAKDPYSPVNNDINGWNTGTVTINSVSGNYSTRAITVITATADTQAADYLHMDIKGIVNSSIPKDFGTEGYTVDIKTFSADGALLESIYAMPFFITAGGQNAITGEIHGVAAGHNGTISVFLGSPMTGPMEASVSVTGSGAVDDAVADGFYDFTNLPDGEYYIFTEPTFSVGGNAYFGQNAPEPIRVYGATGTKNIYLTPETSGGAAVTVTLAGNFSTGGVPDDVDVFAGSPSGFRVKTFYGVGDVTGGTTTTLYLSNGDWMIGIGPARPQGPMTTAPPMPDWMPPMNVYYRSDGVTPGNMTFNISGQSIYTVSGTVTDGTNPIADAEVWAYQPMGGYGGANTKTATDGTFILKIPVLGTYKLGAYKPGLPSPLEKSIEVTGNMTGQTIKITKPAYTISGKILNSSGQAVAYAPVWSWQENSWGHADTKTDASGNYILYVNNGIWQVETDIPGAGWIKYGRTITVNNASVGDINLSPSISTNFYTISGLVGIDTNNDFDNVETPFANMPIRAVKYDANGAYQGKEYNSTTNSSGAYTISVPAGIYRVDIWTPEYGEIGVNDQDDNTTLNEPFSDDKYPNNPANVNATGGNVGGANIIVKNSELYDVSLTFTNAQVNQAGYLNVEGSNGFHLFRRIDNLAAGETIKLAGGYYYMLLDVPGVGNFKPDINDVVDINSATSVSFTLLDLNSGAVTINGTVRDGASQPVGNAWVWVGHPSNGYHTGTQTATTGSYALTLPSGTGYKMGADKPGYMSGEPIDLNATASSTQNFTLNTFAYSISGKLWADMNSDSVFQATEAVPNGFVRAETTKCTDTSASGSCVKAHAPVDGTGFFELGVVNGVWKIYGMANGFNETYYGATITVSGADAVSKNIKLTANAGWNNISKQKPIVPASGGTLDDTATSGTKIKLTIPPNALGSSNSTGNVNAQKTSAITKTNSSDPLINAAVSVSATDNSGQAITNLSDYIDIEMVLYKTDVDTAIAAEELTYAKLKNTKNAYWDDTANDWVNLTTTRKAYYATSSTATNWTLYSTSTASSFETFIDGIASGTITVADYKLVYTSKTNHLTIFAVIMPFIAQASAPPAGPPPATPVLTGGGSSFPSTCRIVEYGPWKGDCVDGYEYRDVISRSPSNCVLSTEQQNDQKRSCTAEAEDLTESAETETTETPASINELYLAQGDFIWRAEVDEIMSVLGVTERNHVGEQLSRGTLINRLKIDLAKLEPRVQYALTNFITYGSPDTLRLGWGERAGVLNSFIAAFGKAPATADDWSDIIKIGNGRWPTARSEKAENDALAHFKKIYLRDPNRQNPHDDAAVTVIAYGLRPANRNMGSEAAAARIFRAIYGYAATGATDWDIVRAIAYSGAVR